MASYPRAPLESSRRSSVTDPATVYGRVLAQACAEAGVEWAGRNAVQVQHWLGHHSAAFTLATYVHLLDGDLGGPVVPYSNREESANKVQTCPTPTHAISNSGTLEEVAA